MVNQSDGVSQRHQEPSHHRLRNRNRPSRSNLVDEEGNGRASRAHYVAVSNHRDDGVGVRPQGARDGLGNLLHHRLGHAHGVDRKHRLVRRKADDASNLGCHRGAYDVLRSHDIGANRLHRKELARGHLLERGGVKDAVHTFDGAIDACAIADVANIEPHSRVPKVIPKRILLFLVSAEHPDFVNAEAQQILQHRLAEGSSSSSY